MLLFHSILHRRAWILAAREIHQISRSEQRRLLSCWAPTKSSRPRGLTPPRRGPTPPRREPTPPRRGWQRWPFHIRPSTLGRWCIAWEILIHIAKLIILSKDSKLLNCISSTGTIYRHTIHICKTLSAGGKLSTNLRLRSKDTRKLKGPSHKI